MYDRTSLRELKEMERLLSERDKRILTSIRRHRYLTTDHIRRLHFAESANPSAGLRSASRSMKQLKDMRLIAILSRRLGGVRAGSGSYIWYLDAAGDHLVRVMEGVDRPRRRFFEPSTYFLAHTLAVSECYIRITEICTAEGMKLIKIQSEPDSWRPYILDGKPVSLKPDLFAVTVSGAYEDRWYVEIDLDTESSTKIIEKCRRYHQYYRSGLEQKQFGVFPLVVWFVPNEERKTNLMRHLQREFAGQPNIFTIITPDELEARIKRGAEGGSLC